VSAPNERVDLEALKATKARRKGADTVISSAPLIGSSVAPSFAKEAKLGQPSFVVLQTES